jgi:hypothetical protein
MSLSLSQTKFLSRITGIPIHQVAKWNHIAQLAVYKSPVHNNDDPRTYILLMKKLYSNVKKGNAA